MGDAASTARPQAADRERGADDRRQVRVRGGERVALAASDVEVEVRCRLVVVHVSVAVDPARPHRPEAEGAERDEQRPREHLAAAFDDERQ
jgi:hypothetical protein